MDVTTTPCAGEHIAYTRSPHVVAALQKGIKQGLLTEDAPLAVMLDLAILRRSVRALFAAFPDTVTCTHALAVKVNPLPAVLRVVHEEGMGAEVASPAELEQAVRHGFPPRSIFFDSPCKTRAELRAAMQRGVRLNLDSVSEIKRVAAMRAAEADELAGSTSLFWTRINPQLGPSLSRGGAATASVPTTDDVFVSKIASSSTATNTSKFGVGLRDHREELLRLYAEHAWLTGVHVHVGSQGCPLEMTVEGVGRVMEFVEAVNAQGVRLGRPQQIQHVNIGGGVPTDYDTGDFEGAVMAARFKRYVAMLQARVPSLLGGKYHIQTEMGRAMMQKAGVVASRVEYTKITGGRPIAITHAGAHLFLRTAYLPTQWPHHITVHRPDGSTKEGKGITTDVAGPLCFSGDLLARGRVLPPIVEGDWLVVHDAGGYTMSMFSHYNSRPAPPTLGVVHGDGGDVTLSVLCRGQTVDEALLFWQR